MRKYGITKTTVVGGIMFVIGLCDYLSKDDFFAQYPKATATALAVSGTLMIVLRVVTTLPLFGEGDSNAK